MKGEARVSPAQSVLSLRDQHISSTAFLNKKNHQATRIKEAIRPTRMWVLAAERGGEIACPLGGRGGMQHRGTVKPAKQTAVGGVRQYNPLEEGSEKRRNEGICSSARPKWE